MTFDGQTHRFTERLPLPSPADAEIAAKMAEIGALSMTVPPEAPQRAERAPEWDRETAETWLLANVRTEGARFYLRALIGTIFGSDARDLSMLQFLFYVRSSGGSLERLTGIEGGAQELRLVGGTQQISERMARALGRRVRLRHPVRRIEQQRGAVAVTTDRGTFRARRVIVAIAPALAGRIAYDPPLPAARDLMTQRYYMGALVKCQAVYPEPFWRANGLSGISFSDQPPVGDTFDNSPPSGRPGILVGFMDGHEAIELTALSADARRRQVLEAFARIVGPRALDPVRYVEGNWPMEPWSRGGPVGIMPPGGWTAFGDVIRTPVGRIHWAGTETATVWNGYMDGAVRAGERAAAEVAEALG